MNFCDFFDKIEKSFVDFKNCKSVFFMPPKLLFSNFETKILGSKTLECS